MILIINNIIISVYQHVTAIPLFWNIRMAPVTPHETSDLSTRKGIMII